MGFQNKYCDCKQTKCAESIKPLFKMTVKSLFYVKDA